MTYTMLRRSRLTRSRATSGSIPGKWHAQGPLAESPYLRRKHKWVRSGRLKARLGWHTYKPFSQVEPVRDSRRDDGNPSSVPFVGEGWPTPASASQSAARRLDPDEVRLPLTLLASIRKQHGLPPTPDEDVTRAAPWRRAHSRAYDGPSLGCETGRWAQCTHPSPASKASDPATLATGDRRDGRRWRAA